MILLQAALAFSVLMIALSTAATSLTEVYLRTFSRRPRVLARALYQFFKTHPDAETLLKKVINSQDDKTQKFRQDVVDGINKTESKILNAIRKQRGNDTELDALALKTVMDVARNPSIETRSVAPRPRWMVDKLSTYAFLQRLADTDLVRTYIDDSQLPDKIEEEVLKRLSLGFERYIAASNELFRKHARLTTMIAAFILAVMLNVQAGVTFQFLLDNPSVRTELVDSAEEKLEEYEAAEERYQKAFEEVINSADENGATDEEKQAALDEARENFEALKGALDTDYSLPIGTDELVTALRCNAGIDIDLLPAQIWHWIKLQLGFEKAGSQVSAPDPKASCETTRTFTAWVFDLALAGFLIGLGGPFWYRVYSSLSQVAQILRSIGGNGGRSEVVDSNSTSNEFLMSKNVVDALENGTRIPPEIASQFAKDTRAERVD